ncbi:MAG: hypothetical protein HY807_09240 [Nitrospirae bacterium]|nr:hypothetical protein [Nitrospirota bacterium]
MSIIFISILMLLTCTSSIIWAEDWGSCASELDSLRRAASYASDAAQSAESAKNEYEDKKEEVEDKKNDLRSCLDFPDIYDLYGDRCESQRREYNDAVDDYNSAKSDYQSALSILESELSTVGSKIRWVESSCGVDFSPSVSKSDQLNQDFDKSNGGAL